MGLFGASGAEKDLRRLSNAAFGQQEIQRFLPQQLRTGATGGILQSGIQGIGQFIQNPGSLSPTTADAIRPRLALESQNIAQNFRGIQSQQAGAAARSNAPLSIRDALSRALDVSQERAQREARQTALAESGQLQRQDVGQTFSLLDAILQFVSSGRGQSIAGLGQLAQSSAQRQAATIGAIGSLGSAAAAPGAFRPT